MRVRAAPLDEDELDHDVDQVELVDLRRPVRRDVFKRPASYADMPGHLCTVELRLAAVHLGCETAGHYARSVGGLLVAQNPGPNTHPDLPMFPWPAGSSAGRLMSMSDLDPGEYLGGLYRRNLVDSVTWSRERAQRRARSIVTALFEMPRELRVVLCGRKVMRAFGLKTDPWIPGQLDSRQTFVVVPHPSGLSHVYNDPEARRRTRLWMRWAAIGERQP